MVEGGFVPFLGASSVDEDLLVSSEAGATADVGGSKDTRTPSLVESSTTPTCHGHSRLRPCVGIVSVPPVPESALQSTSAPFPMLSEEFERRVGGYEGGSDGFTDEDENEARRERGSVQLAAEVTEADPAVEDSIFF
jgi:hypothetical protein